ncbi:MAG: hypothetical protein M0Z84_08835 [Gammaproteobacteria bacterium]|nr:hypothetical protein [Gammaproteobacteria bacterium]
MSRSGGKNHYCQRIRCTGFLYFRFTPGTGRKTNVNYSAGAVIERLVRALAQDGHDSV